MSPFISVKKFRKSFSVFALSFLFHSIAFTTDTSIELDFKDSQGSRRLHTMMPLSNVQDVDHLELDLNEQSVTVHKENKTTETDDLSVAPCQSSLILSKENIQNLPWHLGKQGLEYFLFQHTAWLTPLGENNYKLDFRGRLLGGGGSDDDGDYGDYGGGDNYDSGDDGGDNGNYGRDNDHEGNYGGGPSSGGNIGGVLEATISQFTVDCGGRSDYPPGTYGHRYCSNTGLDGGGGGYGNYVINTTGQSHGKSSNNSSDGNYGGNTSNNNPSNQISNNVGANQPAAPTSQFDFNSLNEFFNNLAANQPTAPASQPASNPLTEFLKNAVASQPATPASQPNFNSFVEFFNNLATNQPAAPASQPNFDSFAEFLKNAVASQPATPASQPNFNSFVEFFNNLATNQPATPEPAPVVEQPATPEPVAEQPAALTLAPTTEQPVTPEPAPVTEQPATPEPAPVTEQPVAPVSEPVAEQPVTPAPEPVIEQPVAPAPEPVAEQPVAPAPEPVAEQPVAPTPEPVAEQPVAPAPEPVAEQPVAPAPEPVVEQPVAPAPAPVVEQPVAPAPAPVAEQLATQLEQPSNETVEENQETRGRSRIQTSHNPLAQPRSISYSPSRALYHMGGWMAEHPQEALENASEIASEAIDYVPVVGPLSRGMMGQITPGEAAIDMARDLNPLKKIDKVTKTAQRIAKAAQKADRTLQRPRALSFNSATTQPRSTEPKKVISRDIEISDDFSKKSNLTAKQREQIKDISLVGENPGNIKNKKGKLRIDTELTGGEQAARQKFTELTGKNLPNKIEDRVEEKLTNGNLIIYREMGDSGHPKLEITSTTPQGIILEKITFR
ncbi:MAG: hypothetical protein ACRYGR_06770 [Janthinobacterium lividum]